MEYFNKNKSWSNKDRKFIKDNYLLMNNSQLGENLGRTEDSVRKEFTKMGLKRPKKSELPKIYRKRGRKKKILTVQEALLIGAEKKRKLEKAKERELKKERDEEKRIANEALWASNFLDTKPETIFTKCRELINPIIIQVPDYRATFNIDSKLSAKKIEKRIAAIERKYSGESLIIKNYKK